MVGIVTGLYQAATGGLPTFKISRWTIKVSKETKLKVLGDDSGIIDTIKRGIRWTQDLMAGVFQYTGGAMEEIADFDSFISLNGNSSSQIVKNAIENGSFRSVNKIKDPNKIVIELAKGGFKTDIEEVLDSLKKYQNSTAIFMIITPFGPIKNLNLIGLDYNFTRDNGSNLLIAKLTFQEIVYGSATVQKKNKLPGADDMKNTGKKVLQGISK